MRYLLPVVSIALVVSAVAVAAGPSRIDFADRVIKGQTAKAGAVYIYDRQQTKVESLIMAKRSFRQRVIRTVFKEQ